MMNQLRNILFSLRARFLLSSIVIIFILSLSYGLLTINGYQRNMDNNAFRLLCSESNLLFHLARWENNQLVVHLPEEIKVHFPNLVFIYDQQGDLLWSERKLPALAALIQPEWLKSSGLHHLHVDHDIAQSVQENISDIDPMFAPNEEQQTRQFSFGVNIYPATGHLPPLTIVVVDTIAENLKNITSTWSLFRYLALANLLVVVPLLWIAGCWSLSPIRNVTNQVKQLKQGKRQGLGEDVPLELYTLVHNLNTLLHHERQRYSKYSTTLSDLAHSIKTPLAVLQSTLRTLSAGHSKSVKEEEPVMQAQIARITQQVGYHLNRANLQQQPLTRESHPIAPLLEDLCHALNKVYQRKGVTMTIEIDKTIRFFGERNDFLEVMGNILDNACKYCLEFVHISARCSEQHLTLVIDDDGGGIAAEQQNIIFQRGQRADTLLPGQGLGLFLAMEIVDQYQGQITVTHSPLGGARMLITFTRQQHSTKE